MRQGQQNRRGRGRNNNQNRKGQNPLTRSFESTGPDVKIRGTPAHIAEKYMALARDAQSSGDPVLAENYLQHAEHYNRIIMAFREQQMSQGGGDMANGGGMGRHRPGGFGDPMSMSDDYSDEDGDDMGGDVHQQQPSFPRHEAQPMQPRSNEGQRFEDRGDRGPRQGHDQHRQPHHRDRERHGGDQRGFSDRHDRPERQDRSERFQRPERVQRVEQAPEGGGQQPAGRNDRMLPHHEQPEFLRRPVRRPRREGNGAPGEEPAVASTPAVEDTD